MASPSTKTKPATSRTSSTSKRTSAQKTPSSPKKKTSPKSGATHTTKKAPRKAAATKKRATRADSYLTIPELKPPTEPRKLGKPRIMDLNAVEEVTQRIIEFFDEVAAGKRKATQCGLALALGYSSRTSVWEIAKGDSPISEPINIAMLMIEDRYEGRLDSANCTGAIFALKNRGWKDTQTIEDQRPSQTHVYLPENNRGRS